MPLNTATPGSSYASEPGICPPVTLTGKSEESKTIGDGISGADVEQAAVTVRARTQVHDENRSST